ALSQFSTGANSQATGLSVRLRGGISGSAQRPGRRSPRRRPAGRPPPPSAESSGSFGRAWRVSFRGLAVDQPLAHGAALFVGGASPDAGGDAVLQRPLQARRPRRAALADPFGLVDLTQREPGRADREEQIRIGAGAGGV